MQLSKGVKSNLVRADRRSRNHLTLCGWLPFAVSRRHSDPDIRRQRCHAASHLNRAIHQPTRFRRLRRERLPSGLHCHRLCIGGVPRRNGSRGILPFAFLLFAPRRSARCGPNSFGTRSRDKHNGSREQQGHRREARHPREREARRRSLRLSHQRISNSQEPRAKRQSLGAADTSIVVAGLVRHPALSHESLCFSRVGEDDVETTDCSLSNAGIG